jgi:hypothetical protein
MEIIMGLRQPQPQPQQEQAPQQEQGEFSQTPTPELISGIHDAMLQLLQNLDESGQANPQQKQAMAGAIQTYRNAIEVLGGEGQQAPQPQAGGNVPVEAGASDVLPAG